MNVEHDPIFTGVAITAISGFLGIVLIKLKRTEIRVAKWIKKKWQMFKGSGISLAEHEAAIDDLKKYIDEKTYPIQKDSNGGSALPDVVKALERIEKRQIEIGDTGMKTLGMLEGHIDSKNAHT